jgi:FkbM family methyltransferase
MFYGLSDSIGVPLDCKLDNLFKKKENEFYIELGGNDGLRQSNTAFFEFNRKWKGILIEPSIDAFQQCVKNRPNSIVLNYACVSNEYAEKTVTGDFNGNLMSSVDGKRLSSSSLVEIPAITLTSILDKYIKSDQQIDLLSLDTEGYELNILKGLDLEKWRPTYMLIEIYTKDFNEIKTHLAEKGYSLLSNFSNYSKTTNPHWDGTHNDYLFIDTKIDT